MNKQIITKTSIMQAADRFQRPLGVTTLHIWDQHDVLEVHVCHSFHIIIAFIDESVGILGKTVGIQPVSNTRRQHVVTDIRHSGGRSGNDGGGRSGNSSGSGGNL